MQSCRFGRNFDIFSSKRNLVFSLFRLKLNRKDFRCLTKTFSCNMENKAAVNDKEPALSKATSGDVVKSESQLKKDAKRLEKLEKFRKKKEAQEAEKKNQGEVVKINLLNSL